MINLFTKHPRSVNETYLQHLYFASKFGFTLMLKGFINVIHGFLPFLFEQTASDYVKKMAHRFKYRHLPEAEVPPMPAEDQIQ